MLAYGSSFSFRTISVPAVAVYASGAPAIVAVCWVTEEIGLGGSLFSSFFSPSFLSPSFASGSSPTATPAVIAAASTSASPVVIRFTQPSPRVAPGKRRHAIRACASGARGQDWARDAREEVVHNEMHG